MPCRNDVPEINYTGILVELLCEAVNIAKGAPLTKRLAYWKILHSTVDEKRVAAEKAKAVLAKKKKDLYSQAGLSVANNHPLVAAVNKADTELSDAERKEWAYLEQLMSDQRKKG